MSIRSFIAIPIPQIMANALGDCAGQMAYQDKSNAVRWVDQANYHVTLAFLGDQDQSVIEQVADSLDQELPHFGFDFKVSHLSPFPESRPKLIAAIIEKTAQMMELQQSVQSALKSCSVTIEKRKFNPHITLGRYRHSRNHFAGAIPTNFNLEGEVNEVTFYESVLTPNGAEYEPLFRFPMGETEYDEV